MTMSVKILVAIAVAAGLAGCSAYERLYQPAEYHPVTDVRPGAGLFTGESGVVTLVGGDKPDTGAGPAGDDDEVVSGKPGEPVVIKRHRSDR
ncbi:MAG TPA: hypothetical protein VMV26_14690 [Alphaproteobacteria bacterium]|jgi:hypothetical protein|nr:hypothetical protein [Alphaproteobacteria bacterium]